MKLAVIGGGGTRTPLLVNGLARHAEELGLREVALYDASPERLRVFGGLAAQIARGSGLRVELCADADAALNGAAFVFIAIRVGGDRRRAEDERICLRHRVLGQETTGPAGMAMALRTIPVVADYAARAPREAWILNFTNPAGLVTQALVQLGHRRVIGLCDVHSIMARDIAAFLAVPQAACRVGYLGLNHLGWVPSVKVDGNERLPELLDRYEALAARSPAFGAFEPDLVRALGLLLNEYLYFYYCAREAVERVLAGRESRGEQVARLNAALWARLSSAPSPQEAMAAYTAALAERNATYMTLETGGSGAPQAGEALFQEEGYEGLAIAAMASIAGNLPHVLTLNVPAGDAVPGMAAEDVVEVPCAVDATGVRPLPTGPVPDSCRALMQPVKAYERLTVRAALGGDRRLALLALDAHPLVPSHAVARALLNDLLAAGRDVLPRFHG